MALLDPIVRFFLLLDSVLHCVFGVILFLFPHSSAFLLLNHPSDGVHWHLLRCVGAQLLASSTLSWRCSSRHRPPEVRSSCLVLRLLSAILCAFLFFHTRSVHPELIFPALSQQLVWFFLFVVALSLLLLVFSGWPIGDNIQSENRVGNILYQIDTIAAISIGMAWVLAPHWLLHRQVRVPMDNSHAFCGQLMGVMFIASQVISAHALHWRDIDRAMAAETRGVLCLLILSAQFWSQIAYGAHWSDKHWVGICLFSTWTATAVFYRMYLWLSSDASRSADQPDPGRIRAAAVRNGNHLQKRKAA